jgi:MFS family permease
MYGSILLFSLINYVAMLMILSLSRSYILSVVTFCLLGVSHGLIYPTGILIIAETVEIRKLAFSNSIYMTGWDVGNALGPIISAPFAVNYGTESALVIGLLGPGAALLVLSLQSAKRMRKPPG